MEMCPYCGEDVPDDSSTCWKCGTELAKDGEPPAKGGASDEEGEPTIEQRGASAPKGKGGPKVECPFCQALIPQRAMRCNECGRPLVRAGRANWIPHVYAAFGLVLAGTLVWLIMSFVATRKPAPDPGRDTPLARTYVELERVFLKDGGNPGRRQTLWKDDHLGRFVEWEGVVVKVDKETRTVELAESSMAAKPQVVVVFKDDQSLDHLKEEKQIRYSARLEEFGGGQFKLSLGVLLE